MINTLLKYIINETRKFVSWKRKFVSEILLATTISCMSHAILKLCKRWNYAAYVTN